MRAIEEININKKIKIITVDLTNYVKKNLKKNNIIATICQQPYIQGSLAVEILFDYIMRNKTPLRKVINTKTEIITKENM